MEQFYVKYTKFGGKLSMLTLSGEQIKKIKLR